MCFHAPCGVVLYFLVCKLYTDKEKKSGSVLDCLHSGCFHCLIVNTHAKPFPCFTKNYWESFEKLKEYVNLENLEKSGNCLKTVVRILLIVDCTAMYL